MPYNLTMPTDFQDGQGVSEGHMDPIVQNIDWLKNKSRLYAIKPIDEFVNNSATLQDDDDLAIILEPSTIYHVEFCGVYDTQATPGFKTIFVGPSGITGLIQGCASGLTAFNGVNVTTQLNWGGGGTQRQFITSMRLVVSTTGGTFKVQWAQQNANATNTTLRAGTFLRAWVIG
jgi:hypothetical protein